MYVHEDRSFGDGESFINTQDENYDLVLSDNDQPLTYQIFLNNNSFSDGSSDNELDSDVESIIDDKGSEPGH